MKVKTKSAHWNYVIRNSRKKILKSSSKITSRKKRHAEIFPKKCQELLAANEAMENAERQQAKCKEYEESLQMTISDLERKIHKASSIGFDVGFVPVNESNFPEDKEEEYFFRDYFDKNKGI